MIQRLFLDHPRSVGESYGQHFKVASRVGVMMIGGGLAALVHAIVPSFCKTTGSRMIRRLNAQLQGRRATEAELSGALTYEI